MHFHVQMHYIYADQIHFEERQYTFSESSHICVTVRLVGEPVSEHFSISYSFGNTIIFAVLFYSWLIAMVYNTLPTN